MKILFVIKQLTLAGGGAERVLADVSAELARRGHDVSIVTFDPPEARTFYPFAVPVHRLGVGNSGGRTGLIDLIRRGSALRRWVKAHRPDVVVGFMHSSYVLCSLALPRSINVVASEHIVLSYYRDKPLQGLSAALGRMLSSKVVAPIEGVGTTIPNPVPPPRGRADPVGPPDGPKRILAIGRMEAQKNHRLLISAFASIAGDFPDWSVRIIGDGSLRGALERQVRDLGMAGRIDLPRPRQDAAFEYMGAQIFAMPSRFESFGMVTAEALSYGLPVIGLASCPGTNRLVVDGRNGILTDERHFARDLARLMADAGLRRKLATGLVDPDSYAIANIAAQWEVALAG